MDYSKMINIRRETNANDNAFAMPVRRQTDDTDDSGGASTYYGRRIIYAVLSTEYTKKKCSNGMTVRLGSDTVEKYDLKRKSQRELKTIIEKALQNYYENVQEVE